MLILLWAVIITIVINGILIMATLLDNRNDMKYVGSMEDECIQRMENIMNKNTYEIGNEVDKYRSNIIMKNSHHGISDHGSFMISDNQISDKDLEDMYQEWIEKNNNKMGGIINDNDLENS